MAYFGNKRREVEGLYNEIKHKLPNIEYIIEPFCGSSAFSYYISTQHPGKYKYILNDNNEHLIELYKICLDEQKLDNLIIELANLLINLTKEKYDKLAKIDTLINWVFIHIIYNIRPGIWMRDRKIKTSFEYLKQAPIIKFLQTEI